MKPKHIVAEIKSVKDNGVITGAIASSQTVDRDNDVLVQTGWELDNFKKSPVLLWSHDPYSLPVGNISDIKVQDGQLIFDAKFATFDEFGSRVWEMVKNGMLTSFSVGFVPKMQDSDGRITQMELLEISVVNIPANTEARITDSAKLEMVKSFREAEMKFIGKAGRVLSEQNRTLIKGATESIDLAVQTLTSAKAAFNDLLDMSQPDEPVKEATVVPVRKSKIDLKNIPPDERAVIRSMKIIDKAAGIVLERMNKKFPSSKGGDMKK